MRDAWIWPVVAASLAYALATISGVPALRQDWGPSPFHTDWRNILDDGFSGWALSGIGSPRAYLVEYVISLPIAVASVTLGERVSLFLLLLAIGALVAFGARALARDAGCAGAGCAAAALFAVFNPWTYTELVAGHMQMLLAYGASFWLLREALAQRPRPVVLTVAALLTMQQLQFFIVSTLVLAILAVRRRVWKPLAVVAVLWLPSVIGVLADRGAFDAIPFALAWERNQSVAPLDALQLNGYFAGYGGGFRGVFSVAPFAALALALLSLRERSRRVLAVAAGTLAALVVAMGTLGPGALPFAWSVEHVRFIEVFRELFDVLGYAAIGYVLLASVACSKLRFLQWPWLACGVLLCCAWLVTPAQRYWVPAQLLPMTHIAGTANTRFALVPAFQPLSFRDRGSGADPDERSLPGNVTPLNDYLASYPANAALAAFLIHDDREPLEALSVAVVVDRPWLRSNTEGLATQYALPFDRALLEHRATTTLRASPELALVPVPSVGALDTRLGSSDIFFADAAEARGVLVPAAWRRYGPILAVGPARSEVDARRGWVDARLAFADRPELAQPVGGALTTSSSALLPLKGGVEALVFVEGRLLSNNGRVLATSTRGYRWIEIPPSTGGVRCTRLCVVAAQGSPPAEAPLEPPAHSMNGVAFHAIAPWLLEATLPAGPAGALRYNVAYAPWDAFLHGVKLSHVRLDGSVNGWLLPIRSQPEHLVVVESVAAWQFAAEIFALIVLAAAAAETLRRRRRSARA